MSLDRFAPVYSVLDTPDAHASAPCQTQSTVTSRSPNKKSNKKKSKGSKSTEETNEKSDSSTKESDECIETYFQKLEHLLHQCHWTFIDNQTANLQMLAEEMRKGFANGPAASAEAAVKYFESTTIGHEIADLDLKEKLARGVEYVEQLVEHSKFAHGVHTALSRASNKLLTYDELPFDWQENPYIRDGYRFSGSLKDCAFSIFRMHNETMNIWSHLLGIGLFVGLGLFHMPQTDPWKLGSWMDRLPMIIFVVGALKCLFCSVFWHSCCSICHLDVKKKMACVDYTGIVVCICASILTTEYSVLKCHPIAQAFYMCVTLGCGMYGLAMSWNPKFDTTGAKTMRATFFCCFAMFGGLCGIHALFYRGAAETWSYYAPVVKSIMCYFVGVLFYATLFPEKYITEFNFNWGMSHNIWHCFVLAGIYYHYRAMLEMFSKAATEVCPLR